MPRETLTGLVSQAAEKFGVPGAVAGIRHDGLETQACHGVTSLAEAFLQNYPEGQRISRERDRLTSAINRAAGEGAGNAVQAAATALTAFPTLLSCITRQMCRVYCSHCCPIHHCAHGDDL